MVTSFVALLAAAAGFNAPLLHAPRSAPAVAGCRATDVQMINLFGNNGEHTALRLFFLPRARVPGVLAAQCGVSGWLRLFVSAPFAEESSKRREALSFRSARTGDRKVTFRKPNTATEGLRLGLKFRESFGKAVYIDKILPGTEAARLEKDGKIRCGDEIVMVSATFGDEMWSARGVGKYRLEKSIAVRQGATISFVVENSDDGSKKRMRELAMKQKKEQERVSRLQKMMTKEVEAEKKKGGFFGGLF